MRILLIHNYYQQPGGEDSVFRAERALLEEAGHEITVYERNNAEIDEYGVAKKFTLALRTTWATDTRRHLRRVIGSARPEIAHFHNTFPLVSPAAWYLCDELGVPVVQTLHNYRWLCPNAQFFRDGHVCEDCMGRIAPWPGILHACYRGSRGQTAATATMLTIHRLLRSQRHKVSAYIALSEFARRKFLDGGWPGELIHVKPNFVHPDPGVAEGSGDYALFVGRLSQEKGLPILLAAWHHTHDILLKVAGNGPAFEESARQIEEDGLHVELLGQRTRGQVMALLENARCLVFPSELYENFPMVIAEAFACGRPVIASRIGSAPEIIKDQVTGYLYDPGNAKALAAAVESLWYDPATALRMGSAARREFEAKYGAAQNYELLMEIYGVARQRVGRKDRS